MNRKDDGYIVVETVGAFIPFVLLVISILSLVNIITLQARIHFALTQTAGTLSMYCYVLEATGISDELAVMDAKATAFNENIESILDGIEFLSGKSEDLPVIETDPVEMIQNFANYGLNELRGFASKKIAEPLFYRYLTAGKETQDEFFDRHKIVNFTLADCILVDENDNVRLTAEYEAEYTFGALKLPFTPTLQISQTVVTKAWLGGSGEGYRR